MIGTHKLLVLARILLKIDVLALFNVQKVELTVNISKGIFYVNAW